MGELLDVANAFGTPLKLAWIGWLAWGLGQAFWYKYERANARAAKSRLSWSVSRKAAPKRQKPAEPLVPRLITPQQVEAAPKVKTVVPPAPAFDPSKAVVETFDARDSGSLDAIVADMEAHMPRRVGVDASHIH